MAVNQLQQRHIAQPVRGRTPVLTERSATVIAALLPFTQLIKLQLVGIVFLQDVLAIPLLAVLLALVPNKASLLKPLKPLLLLTVVWFLGAVVTDIWVGTAAEDIARGWSKISLFLIHTLVLWLLSRGNLKVLAFYLLGSGIVYILNPIFFPNWLHELDIWKFGLGIGFLMIAASLTPLLSNRGPIVRRLPLLMMIVVSLISLILNSRSLFGIGLLSSLYCIGAEFLAANATIRRMFNRGAFLIVIITGALVAQVLIAIYSQLAAEGYLGTEARWKYELQTTGDMNVLQGGRPETLVSFRAIGDSPIIGHGSWARDRYYSSMYFDELNRRGLIDEGQWAIYNEGQRDIIPSHSHLFGAWVETGIAGVPIWIFAILVAIEALYAVLKLNSLPNLFPILIAFMVMWDVLFSPFGMDARMLKAAQLCVLISVATSLRASAKQYYRR